MVKDKKGKSKIVKRIIAIVIGVPLLALLAVLLFNLPKILYFGRNMWMSIDTGHKMVDTTNGTDPDIYIPYTAEEYFIKQDLKAQGTDETAYEVRLTWDKTLQYVIGLVDGETN